MYVVFDGVTETLIGPFNDYEDAQMFILHASDLIIDGNVSELTIEPISEPQEWALDNSLEPQYVQQ
jgi:hypothetical protein